jgi:VWFA-related protein
MSRTCLAVAALMSAAVLRPAVGPEPCEAPPVLNPSKAERCAQDRLLERRGGKVPGPAQQPTFRSSVDAVTVDVSVRAGSRVITGLTAADFEILDNNVAQEIADLSYEKLPIDVTVGLDVSQSVSGVLLDQLRTSVRQLMADLTKQDRLKLVTFNHRIGRVIDFTADLPAVSAAVKPVTASGGTSLLDAIAVALISASDTTRRQLVVMFSDGSDGHSISDESMVVDVARRSRATLDLVRSIRKQQLTGDDSPISAQQTERAGTPEQQFYATLTGETGGLVVPVVAPGGDVTSTFRRLLSQFRSCYVLRFTPRGVDRGGYHTLAVRTKRPERLDVRARRGYFGG